MTIPAYKVVLSAQSDFFKSLLRNNSHSHPLIYLSGIHSTNLSLVLDWIYSGEIQINQEDLDSFLELARKLKIKGLTIGAAPEVDKNSDIEEKVAENEVDVEMTTPKQETVETEKNILVF